MPPPSTKQSKAFRCPAPTSGAVRKELQSSQKQLAQAAFSNREDRLEFLELLFNTYGELGPGLLAKMDLDTWLSPGKVFLDIGAGIGEPAISVLLLLNSPFHFFANFAKCAAEKYPLGCHQFVHADVRASEASLGRAITCASVTLINNKVFDAALMLWIELQLKQFAQANTHIFVTARLGSIRRPMPSPNFRRIDDISFLLTEHPDIIGYVSWTNTETAVYHYVFRQQGPTDGKFSGPLSTLPGFIIMVQSGRQEVQNGSPLMHHARRRRHGDRL
ncbi:hypothetical protein B0H14DRAFT_2579643 [Mycena olivaceomarginata]|nr:hypothetical protein B0H14DRAFT_2579643 [Mycena olivaceomarginata]